ncbi:dihydrofolate reductase [Bacillus sp. SM2101]|uniref:dihydrofolate reductase n=1 Tax=Bacillus sp. SM2101 TaxID=2805366 RepID=UPI001BDE3799|nr:dihydrofolate reductase [Bacillus sp. SM2101]
MLSIIVAFDKNRTIGKNNSIPWHLPNDLAHVKRITMGHTVVMGRKTFDSIGRPLPDRKNVVLTRDQNIEIEGVQLIHTIDDIFRIEEQANNEEVFIFGGETLYKQLFQYVDKLYVTFVDATYAGDTYFPFMISDDDWLLKSKTKGLKDEDNKIDYYFLTYERRRSEEVTSA